MLKRDCKVCDNPALLIALFLLFLVFSYFLGWSVLIAYVALLFFVGALALALAAQGIIYKICWKWFADKKGSGSQGHPPSNGVKLPPSIYKRPDPMIYSQYYLVSQGLAVTWDNPDIDVIDPASPGTILAPDELKADTTYRLRAQVWNLSNEAPAVNLLVKFHYLDFGIGVTSHYIAETLINLGVRGSPSCPAYAESVWHTPVNPGHYCLLAEIIWADDANPFNNLGQKNVQTKKLNSPNATFQFQMKNMSAISREVVLKADSYRIPKLPDCTITFVRDEKSFDASVSHMQKHRIQENPVPEGWQINFFGNEKLEMEPGEEITTKVKITAPNGFVGTQAININGFADGNLIGGVTLYVHD